MKLDHLISQFLLSNVSQPRYAATTGKRESAVLLPLVEVDGHAELLFCKRPNYLASHPSQICFPGGKLEPHDLNLAATALRESHEEIGLLKENVNMLGALPSISTLTGFVITPFVAVIKNHHTVVPHSDEVECVFSIPYHSLKDNQRWQYSEFTARGRAIKVEGFMTQYGLLWGATAKIVKSFIKLT
ncbi:NUDIX hydrolase [Pseudoalteromonas sp. T1lg65]|uniref:NUDIX hydrolase n=1 Tax=Pseudoalteromonas sp. T1lg65 TaxID=2077101 RepID=UPI003F79F77D